MREKIGLFLFLITTMCSAQYSFSGFINPEDGQSPIYLSIVEDYRKLEGVYSEQIIAKTNADETGFFEFTGNLLEEDNRIYRIHIDKCSDSEEDFNHSNGLCNNSEQLLFIARNSDTLNLPFSFGQQIFCAIESNNPKANTFLRIDSLKQDMRFAYSEFRSEANRKLNNKKWFKTLQDYGEKLNEPLAELYIYAFLSDRSSDLHGYYVEDLNTNSYYEDLEIRLENTYPESTYTQQYKIELQSDRYMLEASSNSGSLFSRYWIYLILVLSLGLNFWFVYINRKHKSRKNNDLESKLSKQERVVLGHLLEDKTNKDIAEALFLSVSTVKSHTNNIYKKLNVQSRDEVKTLFSR